jgi:cadmium resistance protein CadD (predicted permease)
LFAGLVELKTHLFVSLRASLSRDFAAELTFASLAWFDYRARKKMKQDLAVITQAATAFVAVNTDEIFVLVLFFAFCIAGESSAKKKSQSSWNGMTLTDVVLGQYFAFSFIVTISVSGSALSNIFPLRYLSLLGAVPLAVGLWQLYGVFKFWYKKYLKSKSKQNSRQENDNLTLVYNEDILLHENAHSSERKYILEIEPQKENDVEHEARKLGSVKYNSFAKNANSDSISDSDSDSDSDTSSDAENEGNAFQRWGKILGPFCCRMQMALVFATLLADGSEEICVFVPIFATCSSWQEIVLIIITFYVLLTVSVVFSYSLVSCQSVASFVSRYSKNIMPLLLIALGVYILCNA